jgi:diguanylate cyclase (GGDEF)-like protein
LDFDYFSKRSHVEPPRDNGKNRDKSLDVVADKTSSSLRSQDEDIIRRWLSGVIKELGLDSLESFPVQELATGFPALIDHLARAIQEPDASAKPAAELNDIAASLASIRQENPSLEILFDDFALLKRMVLEAASRDLRYSDMAAIAVAQRLDDGFMPLLRAGLESFIENNSRELLHLANTDALTGLYNVRYFRRQLHKQLELYKRYHIPFSLMMLDLDELKELNDTFGHDAGDRVIKNLASVMCGEKRETDIAVRYGGDEFFLLLPSTAIEEAETLAFRISSRCRALNISSIGSDMTSASIGLAACPVDGTDVGSLRAKADRALYLAKSLGGGSVSRYREFELVTL